jgi:predicted enzyme related to lactoylglutathione lyase
MTKITGIGGFMFRSKNPEELKKWYIEVLGIDIKNMVWMQDAGPTVLEPFPNDSDYYGVDKGWMLNFRVTNLQAFIKELRKKGLEVIEKDEWNSMPEVGVFARVYDPEGNPIELWQPAT